MRGIIPHRIKHADLRKYQLVVSKGQLKEGMVLIDKHAHKRTILQLTDTEIWLSHKYGRRSKITGKTWQLDNFISNFKNWIFKE